MEGGVDATNSQCSSIQFDLEKVYIIFYKWSENGFYDVCKVRMDERRLLVYSLLENVDFQFFKLYNKRDDGLCFLVIDLYLCMGYCPVSKLIQTSHPL